MKTIGVTLLASLLFVPSCTWVPLTTEGEGVRVLDAQSAANCKKVGRITATTAKRVVIFARTDRKIREELEALARNDAAQVDGDAILPLGPPADGRQSFEVYRCAP